MRLKGGVYLLIFLLYISYVFAECKCDNGNCEDLSQADKTCSASARLSAGGPSAVGTAEEWGNIDPETLTDYIQLQIAKGNLKNVESIPPEQIKNAMLEGGLKASDLIKLKPETIAAVDKDLPPDMQVKTFIELTNKLKKFKAITPNIPPPATAAVPVAGSENTAASNSLKLEIEAGGRGTDPGADKGLVFPSDSPERPSELGYTTDKLTAISALSRPKIDVKTSDYKAVYESMSQEAWLELLQKGQIDDMHFSSLYKLPNFEKAWLAKGNSPLTIDSANTAVIATQGNNLGIKDGEDISTINLNTFSARDHFNMLNDGSITYNDNLNFRGALNLAKNNDLLSADYITKGKNTIEISNVTFVSEFSDVENAYFLENGYAFEKVKELKIQTTNDFTYIITNANNVDFDGINLTLKHADSIIIGNTLATNSDNITIPFNYDA